jgi:hypothetical protein
VGAHVVERLVEEAGDAGHDRVYAVTAEPGYLAQFGFEAVGDDDLPPPLADRDRGETVPAAVAVDAFEMPPRLRERFKTARPDAGAEREPSGDPDVTAEEFGIDPDEATYKYDTG